MFPNKPEQSSISKLVLFDIDETLINSSGTSRLSLYQALQKCLPITADKLKNTNIRMSGKTDTQNVAEFIAACFDDQHMFNSGIDAHWQTKIEEIVAAYLEILPVELEKAAQKKKFFVHDGVIELLNLLAQNKNIALGLLTGNVEKGARIKLEPFALNKYFPIGAYGCDSASRLDLPAIAHKRAEAYYQTKLTPTQIVIIGDAENDILCAQHYGAVSLAVNTGTTTWEELDKLRPDYLFSCLSNTSQIVDAIMSETKVLR